MTGRNRLRGVSAEITCDPGAVLGVEIALAEAADEFPLMPEKKCAACHRVKKLMHFTRSRHTRDGHVERCRDCVKRDYENRRAANRTPADVGYRFSDAVKIDEAKRSKP